MMTKDILIQLSIAFIFAQAVAQNKADSESKKSPKNNKLAVSFDDELITGKTDLPAGEFIQNKLNNRYKRMIKIRKDFIQEVENSKDDFKNR